MSQEDTELGLSLVSSGIYGKLGELLRGYGKRVGQLSVLTVILSCSRRA